MVRQWAFGDYAIGLSERYVRHSAKELEKGESDFRFLAAVKQFAPGLYLVKVIGMKSRFKRGEGRTVHILFDDGEIEDTLCNCGSGKRTIGGCAHGIAFLRLIMKQQAGKLNEYVKLKSDEIFDSLTIPNFEDDEVTESDVEDECE